MEFAPTTEAWVKLPLELLKREGVSKRAAVLLSVIIDRCKHGQDLSATISADELQTRSGMSRATVCRALDELRALSLIQTTRTGRGSVYKLTEGCVELCPKAVKDDHPAAEQPRKSSRSSSRSRTQSGSTTGYMSEYLSLVNRFKDDDEPLEGQTSFFDIPQGGVQ